MIDFLKKFLNLEAASGIVLMAVAVLAMGLANSPFSLHYETLLARTLGPLPLSLWINDGLMAIFFLLVGLEIKRELTEGELSTRSQALLPLAAACGGVALPSIIYAMFNWGTPLMRGWAIPSATDIAFSLGVLALLGSRVTPSLKIFLMAVAVIDDLIAVLIIALFYTGNLSPTALAGVAACAALLYGMNRRKIQHAWPYLLVGIALWVAMHESGVHATIAGVLLAFLIPIEPLGKKFVHALHPWVAFGIVPLFAFANAGIPLSGITLEQLMHPLPLGIALGLFFGKQFGIFLTVWLLVRTRLAQLPMGASWGEFYGVCMLCGIGFTMSLFIGTLAFSERELQLYMRLGVMVGSLLSALSGYVLMAALLKRKPVTP